MPRAERVSALVAAVLALMPGATRAQQPAPQPSPQMMQAQIQQIAQARPPEAEVAARDFLRRITTGGSSQPVPTATTKGPSYIDMTRTYPPIYIIDGQVQSDSFSPPGLDSASIDRVEIIKGAAATNKYGAKAANGAIEITTRRANSPALATLDSLKTASLDLYWQEVAQLMVQREMATQVGRRDTVRGRAMEQMFALEFQARGIQRAYRAAPEADRAKLRSQLEGIMTQHLDRENQLMEMEIADATRRLDAVKGELADRIKSRQERVRFMVDDIIRDATRPGSVN